jgi:hypothetical protein
MTSDIERPAEAVRHIWQGTPGAMQELDEECNPNKACRNMKDVTFDGFAEEGVDLATAWRNKLAREGKLGGGTLGDLVLGNSN